MLNSYTYGSVAYNSQVTSEPIIPNIPDVDYGTPVSRRVFVREFFTIIGQKLFPASFQASFVRKISVPKLTNFSVAKRISCPSSESITIEGKKKFVSRYAYNFTGKKLIGTERFFSVDKNKLIPVNAGFNKKSKLQRYNW